MKAIWISEFALTFLTLGSLTALAQATAHKKIVDIEGAAFLDEQRLVSSASQVPLKENSVLHTETGRVEILLAGDILFLDETVRCGSAVTLVSTPTDLRF